MSTVNDVSAKPSAPVSDRPDRWLQWADLLRSRFVLQRWLVMFSMGLFVIIIEVRDHQTMHALHQSGQTLWQDRELIREIVMYGFLAPILGGLLLTFLERSTQERNQAKGELKIRQEFVEAVNKSVRWEELVELILHLPGRITAAKSAFLMVNRESPERLELAGWWERDGRSSEQAAPPALVLTDSRHCAATMGSGTCARMDCQHCHAAEAHQSAARHCIVLQSAERLSGLLVFYLPPDRQLTPHQQTILNDLAAEIALALDNIALRRSEVDQAQATADERQRIARNLHDALGQNVSFLRLKLDQISSDDTLERIADIRQEIHQMRDVADDAYAQVRQTLADLRPDANRPLDELLLERIARHNERNGFVTKLHVTGAPQVLPAHHVPPLLFVIEEALNNIERHAAAQQATVQLAWQAARLTVQIVDDGQGFDPTVPLATDHYGLAIMSERAAGLGGRLRVTSAPGSGTQVQLHIPLSATGAGAPAPGIAQQT